MKKDIVWVIQGYEKEVADGRLEDVVLFEVYAESEDKAIERAKELIKKKYYRIQRVIENTK